MEESGKLLVNDHRAPWTKRGARRVGELEWRQREVREKERGAHNKEGQSVSGERPRSGKSHSPGGGVSQETSLVVMGTRGPKKLSPAAARSQKLRDLSAPGIAICLSRHTLAETNI